MRPPIFLAVSLKSAQITQLIFGKMALMTRINRFLTKPRISQK